MAPLTAGAGREGGNPVPSADPATVSGVAAAAPVAAFAREVEAAQAELLRSIERAGLRGDPYGAVVAGLSRVLSLLPGFLRGIAPATEAKLDAVAASVAGLDEKLGRGGFLAPADAAKLVAEVSDAAKSSAGAAVRSQVSGAVRGQVLRTAAVLALAGLALLGVGLGVGVMYGRSTACPADQVREWQGGLVCTVWIKHAPAK